MACRVGPICPAIPRDTKQIGPPIVKKYAVLAHRKLYRIYVNGKFRQTVLALRVFLVYALLAQI